jgi:hypothetical protein
VIQIKVHVLVADPRERAIGKDSRSREVWNSRESLSTRTLFLTYASGGLLLGLAQALDKSHRLALETALESSASTAVDEVSELKR